MSNYRTDTSIANMTRTLYYECKVQIFSGLGFDW